MGKKEFARAYAEFVKLDYEKCFCKLGKQCKPVQVLQFCLLGQYPKPIEFFKLHFEEATPSAKNE